mgnify:FL=1
MRQINIYLVDQTGTSEAELPSHVYNKDNSCIYIVCQTLQEAKAMTGRPPAYGALSAAYGGQDASRLLSKILKDGKDGLIDEYFDIKAADPDFEFKAAK